MGCHKPLDDPIRGDRLLKSVVTFEPYHGISDACVNSGSRLIVEDQLLLSYLLSFVSFDFPRYYRSLGDIRGDSTRPQEVFKLNPSLGLYEAGGTCGFWDQIC